MVIFGWREAKINIQPVSNHSCGCCNTPERLFMQVNGLYVHVFWIPILPLFKKIYSVCGHCKLEMSKSQMPPDLQVKAKNFKESSKAPWWMFLGLFAVAFILMLILTASIINS